MSLKAIFRGSVVPGVEPLSWCKVRKGSAPGINQKEGLEEPGNLGIGVRVSVVELFLSWPGTETRGEGVEVGSMLRKGYRCRTPVWMMAISSPYFYLGGRYSRAS